MTAVTRTNLVWRASTTTEHLNWAKLFSDALTAVGVLKTADTGQIVLTGATLAFPTGTIDDTFKSSGYEIRALTSPGKPTIYMRIEYGIRRYVPFNNTATNNAPVVAISFGTETNGAGVLGGAMPEFRVFSNYGFYYAGFLPTVVQRPAFFSSDGANYLTINIDPSLVGGGVGVASAIVPMQLVIERTADMTTTAFDSDGYVLINASAEAPSGEPAMHRQHVNIVAGARFSSNNIPAQVDPMFSTSASAGATTLFPVTVLMPKPKAPMRSLVYLYQQDATSGIEFSTTIYAEVHSYIACTYRTPLNVSSNSVCYPALRYD